MLRLPDDIVRDFDALVGATRDGGYNIDAFKGGDAPEVVVPPAPKKRSTIEERGPD